MSSPNVGPIGGDADRPGVDRLGRFDAPHIVCLLIDAGSRWSGPLAERLERTLGWTVRACTGKTVNDAAAAISATKPGLVISDFMPDDSAGLALLRHNTGHCGPPLIYYDSHDDPLRDGTVLLSGAADVVKRPAFPRLLTSAVRAIRHDAALHTLAECQAVLVDAHHADFLPLTMDAHAHDLRNLLQPLMYASQMLRRTQDANLQSTRDALDGSLQRGLELVRSMLVYGRERQSIAGSIDVQALMQCVRELLPVSGSSGLTLRLESDLGVVPCRISQVELEQCLLALGRRAVREMPDGGELCMLATRSPASAASPPRLCVSFRYDAAEWGRTSKPVPAQSDRPQPKELVLARVMAARYGGRVALHSWSAHRMAIDLELPLTPDQPEPHREGRRVLIVTRNDTAARAMVDAGLAAGFSVERAGDSLAAARLLDRGPAGATIIDTELPHLEDVRTFALLRKRHFEGQTIVLQSSGADRWPHAERDSVTFVTKPVNAVALFAALRAVPAADRADSASVQA